MKHQLYLSAIFVTLIQCLSQTLFAQEELDSKLVSRQISCEDISENSAGYIVHYFENNNLDSCSIILNYWSNKCGYNEPVSRADMILALAMHDYADFMITSYYFNNLLIFNYRNELIRSKNQKQRSYFSHNYDNLPLGQRFDTWTSGLATSLLREYEPGTAEYLLSLFYSGQCDTVFRLLRAEPYKSTAPGRIYDSLVMNALRIPELVYHLYTGLWIPTGKLSAMGVHPLIGFGLGVKSNKNEYSLMVDFKFLNTPEYYQAKRTKNGETLLTNHFFGGYIGFEYARDLIQLPAHELFYTMGVAFDGFDMFEEDTDYDLKASSANSFNFNIGGGYRLAINPGSWIGIQGRYHVVDYTLNDRFFLKGHTATIRLSYAWRLNQYKNQRLQLLHYSR